MNQVTVGLDVTQLPKFINCIGVLLLGRTESTWAAGLIELNLGWEWWAAHAY
ncbi:hypothetical protein HanPI659440_Chr01g0018881 [Helianthus annuus]|nr:hypothetical protein HanPI659440_Chr01g0018881 [Helianthus annuus]